MQQYKQSHIQEAPLQRRIEWIIQHQTEDANINFNNMRRLFPNTDDSFNALLIFIRQNNINMVQTMFRLHPTILKKLLKTGYTNMNVLTRIPITKNMARENLLIASLYGTPQVVNYLLNIIEIPETCDIIREYFHFKKHDPSFNVQIFKSLLNYCNDDELLKEIVQLCILYISNKKDQCVCLETCHEKMKDMPDYINTMKITLIDSIRSYILPEEKKETISCIKNAIDCFMKKLKIFESHEILYMIISNTSEELLIKIIEHIDPDKVDEKTLTSFLTTMIKSDKSSLSGDLFRKFGSKRFFKKRKWINIPEEIDIIRFAHINYNCDSLAILFDLIPYETRTERIQEEINYNAVLPRGSGSKRCYEILDKIQKEERVRSSFHKLRADTQKKYLQSLLPSIQQEGGGKSSSIRSVLPSFKQHVAGRQIQKWISDIDEIYEKYLEKKKKGVKDPLGIAYNEINRKNPNNKLAKKNLTKDELTMIENGMITDQLIEKIKNKNISQRQLKHIREGFITDQLINSLKRKMKEKRLSIQQLQKIKKESDALIVAGKLDQPLFRQMWEYLYPPFQQQQKQQQQDSI